MLIILSSIGMLIIHNRDCSNNQHTRVEIIELSILNSLTLKWLEKNKIEVE